MKKLTRKYILKSLLEGKKFRWKRNDGKILAWDGDKDCITLDGEVFTDFNIIYPNVWTEEPSWGATVRSGTPVLCWVSDTCETLKDVAEPISGIMANGQYTCKYGQGPHTYWKYATPVDPSECWGEK